MNSNLYFYYGMVQQWLLANGAKRKELANETKETKVIKVKYFDDLPKELR
ncbi:MAG: hypothetical protein FWC13_05360 [Oscillospiraceae bacterium]|nr:hypothetical protein [Oscillospiraceae bacterium]